MASDWVWSPEMGVSNNAVSLTKAIALKGGKELYVMQLNEIVPGMSQFATFGNWHYPC